MRLDLRSDTVTQPCATMRRLMAQAPVGDDVYGEDPTINRLQEEVARLSGQADALFLPSGTQSNLVALLSHCQRGDEYLVANHAHTYYYEGGGASALGGIHPRPIAPDADGCLAIENLQRALRPPDVHFPVTRLLALENTYHGRVLPLNYLAAAQAFAREHGLNIHLDGARAFNAAAALDVPLQQITGGFDSVSLCLSKGLGAPAGTVLAGSRDFIRTARRWRKVVGGGMRQAGILAAAGLHALEHRHHLARDHEIAKQLAQRLEALPDISLKMGGAQTNMLFIQLKRGNAESLAAYAKQHGMLMGGKGPVRLVIHRDLPDDTAARVAELIEAYCAQA